MFLDAAVRINYLLCCGGVLRAVSRVLKYCAALCDRSVRGDLRFDELNISG